MSDADLKRREQQEAKDDIATVIPPPDIVAFNESRSCADLFRLYKSGQLEIKPKFQRGIVWSDKEQALFVDSLIKQLPIPSLCISVDISSQKRMVIDGLQRMWSIIHFLNYCENDWCLPKTQEIDKDLSGRKVSDIKKDSPTLFDKLENWTIPITVIRCKYNDESHKSYLFQIFRRLNTGGSKLLNQEIRNCIYSGKFNDFLHSFVKSEIWLKFANTTEDKVDQARFGHEERILRFFAFNDNWKNYSGNLAQFLNAYMERNQNLSEEEIFEYRSKLEKTLQIALKIEIPLKKRNYKNVIEGILIGIAINSSTLQLMSSDDLKKRYEALLKTDSYGESAPREGMASKDKVLKRFQTAIEVFGGNE